MEFKNYDELMLCVYKERGLYQKLRMDVDSLSVNPFSKDRMRRKEIKEEMQGLQERLDSYKNIIDEATTFKRSMLLPFLSNYLTFTEKENIIISKFVDGFSEDDEYEDGLVFLVLGSIKNNPCLSILGLNDLEDNCNHYFLSNIEVSKLLQLTDYDEVKRRLDELDEQKCIRFSKEEIHMADGTSLKKKYLAYPHLLDVFKRMIDFELQNPEMDKSERLNVILDEIKKERLLKR